MFAKLLDRSPSLYRALLSNLKQCVAVHPYHYCFLIPVSLMLGIAFYFYLPTEPSCGFALLGVPFFAFSVFFFRRSMALLLLCCIFIGFASAQFRTWLLDTKLITKSMYLTKASAVVEEINKKDRYFQVVLGEIENVGKVRIAVRTKFDEAIEVGDSVRLSMKLMPPANSMVVYGYDFAQFAYFNCISAVGYATSPVVLVAKADQFTFRHFINLIRDGIDSFFRDNMSSPQHSIASALIVGKKDVPLHVLNDIRASGLSHLLAISGLHLSLIAALFFKINRWILSRSQYVILRFDAKKIAAAVSIVMITGYLFLTGMSISAQRAYVMVIMVLVALLFDQESSILHSLVIAAVVILLIEPESMMHPSFQMSFAAVMALVRFGRIMRGNYLVSILFSSVVATIATLPYSVYHFNYYAIGGVFANVLAIPLTTFIIIPCGLASAILHSDLAYPFLLVMDYAISWLIKIAHYFASWQALIVHVHSFSSFSLLIVSLGVIWFCMWPNRLSYFGVVFVCIGMLCAHLYDAPDVFLDANNVAVRGSDSKLYFLNSKQRRNFVSKSWLAANAQSELLTYLHHNNSMEIGIYTQDGVNFTYHNHGKMVHLKYQKKKIALGYQETTISHDMIECCGPVFLWLHGNAGLHGAWEYDRPWRKKVLMQ